MMKGLRFWFFLTLLVPLAESAVCQDSLFSESLEIESVETMPVPEKGWRSYFSEASRLIAYPIAAQVKGTQGKVFLEFFVEVDGSIGEIKVIRGLGDGCDEEAIRVLKLVSSTNKFVAGSINGKPIRKNLTIPIQFRLLE